MGWWPHLRLRQLAKKASPWSVVIISESSSASKTSKLTQFAPITANSWSVQQFDSFKWVRLVRLPTKAWNWGTRDICLKESKNKSSSSWHRKEICISEHWTGLATKAFFVWFCIKRYRYAWRPGGQINDPLSERKFFSFIFPNLHFFWKYVHRIKDTVRVASLAWRSPGDYTWRIKG